MDSINSPIMYSFLSGAPSSFRDYFEINPSTGAVRQIKPVDTAVSKTFEIIVKVWWLNKDCLEECFMGIIRDLNHLVL